MNMHHATLLLLSTLFAFAAAPRVQASDADQGQGADQPETENAQAQTEDEAERQENDDAQPQAVPDDEPQGDVLSVEDILAADPKDSDYQGYESRNCIGRRLIRDLEPLDDQHLIIKERNRIWLNRYSSPCFGSVHRGQIPILSSRAGSSFLCDGDQLVWADNLGYGSRAHCRLGRFERITEQQADALRVAYERKRETKRNKRRSKK